VTTDEIHQTVYSVKGLTEGSNATFVCKITGQPKPVIKWFKRGKEIQADGTKIKIQEFKGGYHQLVIADCDTEDSTVYQIRATNQGGSISATVSLDVESKLSMDEVTAKLGQTATLKCQIIGRPIPEIKWYKGGKEIKEGRKYAATSDGRNHTLTISTDQQEDEGLYTCKAVNEAGECETSGTLVLEAAPQFPVPLKDKFFATCGSTVRSMITNYIVEKREDKEGAEWELVSSSITGTSCRIPNLVENEGYFFRVSAQNRYGNSESLETPSAILIKSQLRK
uniref:Obscurin, cytoskeletal calmodulin and titin-interacting RhoGEF b n=1 Tax=Sinocyclocheilus rhinocerous TaxID=307959 RepID=A0A673JA59_9TELE